MTIKTLQSPRKPRTPMFIGVLGPFLSHKLQFSGQLGCPETTSFWDTGISGTRLRDLRDRYRFRDTPLGFQSCTGQQENGNLGFRPSKASYQADREALTSMASGWPRSLRRRVPARVDRLRFLP